MVKIKVWGKACHGKKTKTSRAGLKKKRGSGEGCKEKRG